MVGVRSGKGNLQAGVGKQLRQQREARGLSVEDVSAQLRIPVGQIIALEEEDYSVFSAEVYARGAYTAYTSYLGIDTRTASLAFLRNLKQVREHVPLILHTPETLISRLLHPRIIIATIGIVLALAVGGYIAWQLQSFWRLPHLTVSQPIAYVIEDREVTLEGKAEPLARLQVNGQQVLLRSDSSFAVPLTLHPGINHVKVEVINAAGRIRSRQISLLRTR